jgi:hypothetical protein
MAGLLLFRKTTATFKETCHQEAYFCSIHRWINSVTMRAFRFFVKVSNEGMVHLDLSASMKDREVEVIVLPKEPSDEPAPKAMDFVKQWSGFLSDADTDKARLAYLAEKYK